MLIRHFNTFYDSTKSNWTKGGDGHCGVKKPELSKRMRGKNNPRYIDHPRIVKAGMAFDSKSNNLIQRYGIWFNSKLLCISNNIKLLEEKLEQYSISKDISVFKFYGVCDEYGGIDKIKQKKYEGYTLRQLAKEIGCEYPSICSYLKIRNLKWSEL